MTDQATSSTVALEILRHPLRMRIVHWLLHHRQGRTQREIGVAMSLSTAAIHYHIKLLEGVGVARVASTRPGPNGITEKLYVIDLNLPLASDEKFSFYLESTFAHMQEMQREGESLLAAESHQRGCIAGTYECYATTAEIHALSVQLQEKIEKFHSAHGERHGDTRPISITIGVLPSNGAGWTGKRRAVDFLAD